MRTSKESDSDDSDSVVDHDSNFNDNEDMFNIF